LLAIESTDTGRAVPESDTTPCVMMSVRRYYNNSCDNSRSMDRSHSDSGRIASHRIWVRAMHPNGTAPTTTTTRELARSVGRPAAGGRNLLRSHWSGNPVVVAPPPPPPRARAFPIDDGLGGVAAYLALARPASPFRNGFVQFRPARLCHRLAAYSSRVVGSSSSFYGAVT
jgi:hypothetical protein